MEIIKTSLKKVKSENYELWTTRNVKSVSNKELNEWFEGEIRRIEKEGYKKVAVVKVFNNISIYVKS